ncbi:uncharacterized protein LOC125678037 [Ostrea edulis]|uniref:uncharacterized protein LOC125678037 n=1 Tax=Ostrea edulis TaxID=37623 RepID=UPI0024AF5723|nr:uncharacterized protein LOC125678037 [Ostrea edulis]
MIERPTTYGGTASNFKGLDRSVKHFEAGDVQDIKVSKINSSVIYVRAKCQASMRKQQYQVFICILTTNAGKPNVQHGYCQCPIGLAQACSHIGALLFALSHAKTNETTSESCTSQPCKWIIPGRQTKPIGPISTLPKKKRKLADTEENLDPLAAYDPRHSDDKDININTTLWQLKELRDVFPHTGMSHLWNIPDHAPEAIKEMEVQDIEDPMVTRMKNLIFCEDNAPQITIDHELVEFIETSTRGQRTSEMWQKLHIGRLTSSIFGDVLKAGPNPKSLIKQIVEGSSLQKYASLPPAVQWGQQNEAKARSEYVNLKTATNNNFKVEDTGLTLCTDNSFLGASSDGRVFDGDSIGVLEIKCPYSIKGTQVTTMEVSEIVAMGCPNFCLEYSMEGPRLKKSHKFYAQVQGEMAIMRLPWCDFVVWTDTAQNNICIDRIYFDSEFVSSMMPRLIEFYMHHIIQLQSSR